MLIDREREFSELNGLLQSTRPGFLAVGGRRRLGKTTLLVHWVRTKGIKTTPADNLPLPATFA